MTNAKAIEILREKINEEFSTDTAEAFCMAISALEKQEVRHGRWIGENGNEEVPTIDPVRQGCWVTKDYEYGTDGEEDRWVERIALEGDYAYCSQCDGEILLDGSEDYVYSAYCPHCGAKMKEVRRG